MFFPLLSCKSDGLQGMPSCCDTESCHKWICPLQMYETSVLSPAPWVAAGGGGAWSPQLLLQPEHQKNSGHVGALGAVKNTM